MNLRVSRADSLGDVLEQDRLAHARRGEDQPALAAPERGDQVHRAHRRRVVMLAFQDDPLLRKHRRQRIEGLRGRPAFDRNVLDGGHLFERHVFLLVAPGPQPAAQTVARRQTVLADERSPARKGLPGTLGNCTTASAGNRTVRRPFPGCLPPWPGCLCARLARRISHTSGCRERGGWLRTPNRAASACSSSIGARWSSLRSNCAGRATGGVFRDAGRGGSGRIEVHGRDRRRRSSGKGLESSGRNARPGHAGSFRSRRSRRDGHTGGFFRTSSHWLAMMRRAGRFGQVALVGQTRQLGRQAATDHDGMIEKCLRAGFIQQRNFD